METLYVAAYAALSAGRCEQQSEYDDRDDRGESEMFVNGARAERKQLHMRSF